MISKYTTTLPDYQQKAEQIRSRAAALTSRITEFEACLAAMPGRVPTSLPAPDGSFTLHLCRAGQAWALLVSIDEDKRLLIDSRLAVKMQAVDMFPDLLLAMGKSQQQLIDDIDAACQRYDGFRQRMLKVK